MKSSSYEWRGRPDKKYKDDWHLKDSEEIRPSQAVVRPGCERWNGDRLNSPNAGL